MSNASLQDKRRIVACISALVAIPFYLYCGLAHFCICGHLAHSISWWDFANEFVWIAFLTIALVLSFRSNIPSKSTFIFLTTVMLAFRLLGEGIGTLIAAVALFAVCIQSLRPKKETRNQLLGSQLEKEGE